MSNPTPVKNKYLTPQSLALMAILLAAQIVLSRFLSISTPVVKIGFAFIPIAIAARALGPVQAMIVSALGDFMGALLFPVGAYFPGFTITAALRGLCSGFFLHKSASLGRIASSVVLNELIGSLLLNTLWVSMLMSTPFIVLLPTRLLQAALMTGIQIVTLWLLFAKSGKLFQKFA